MFVVFGYLVIWVGYCCVMDDWFGFEVEVLWIVWWREYWW